MCIKDKIKKYVREELNKYPYFIISDDHISLTYQGDKNIDKVENIISSINNKFGERLIGPLYQEERDHFTTSINEPSDKLGSYYLNAKARNQTRFNTPGDYYNGDTALREQESKDFLMNPKEEEKGGIYRNFVKFKKSSKALLESKLENIRLQKNSSKGNKDVYRQYLEIENKLVTMIEGNQELGIKGLNQEIAILENNPETYSLSVYIDNDMAKLEELSKSSDPRDIEAARYIIDFYNKAGEFNDPKVNNPFFSEEDMYYMEGEHAGKSKLSAEIKEPFIKYREKVNSIEGQIQRREEEVIKNIVNNDSGVKGYYKNNLTIKDILEYEQGLKDINYIDLFFYDISEGISGNTSILAQVMFNYVSTIQSNRYNEITKRNKKIDDILIELNEELAKKGHSHSAAGFIGVDGVRYDIFFQKDRFNRNTGKLIDKFSDDYYYSHSKMERKYYELIEESNSIADYEKREKALNSAKRRRRAWHYQNMMIFDINNVPEIIGENESSLAYKQSIIDVVGEQKYNEFLKEQQENIIEFEVNKENALKELLEKYGAEKLEDIPAKDRNLFELWRITNDPYSGLQDYTNINGLIHNGKKRYNNLYYNVFIPRKNKAEIYFEENGEIKFSNTEETTGFYDERFNEIENNRIFFEAYKIFKDNLENIKNNLPIKMQKEVAGNAILALKKGFFEGLISDKAKGFNRLFPQLWDNLKENIRVVENNSLTTANINPITGEKNYKVNPRFLQTNNAEISSIIKIKTIEIEQILKELNTDISVHKDYKFDLLPSIIQNKVLQYSGVNSREVFEKMNGSDIVNIKKVLKSYATDVVVSKQTLDLPKIVKFFTEVSEIYQANNQALPIVNILMNYYKNIQNPVTGSTGNILKDKDGNTVFNGNRTNAIKQAEDWINKVLLQKLPNEHNITGEKIYTKEEKDKIIEINSLLENETNEDNIKNLNKIKDNLGGYVSSENVLDKSIFSLIRIKALGWNLPSSITNLASGQMSNFITAATGEWFSEESFYKANTIVRDKIINRRETKKLNYLMELYKVLQDSSNELQKVSYKTNFSWTKHLSPYELTRRVEFHNQAPLMVAMLLDKKIIDKNGNESNIWDAIDENGLFKEEFIIEENKEIINNYQNLEGDDFNQFKLKLDKCIVFTHGNYHNLRAMMAKNKWYGKAVVMFKTWMTSAVKQRLGGEHIDLQAGITQKGRYKSINAGSGALAGTLIGLSLGFLNPMVLTFTLLGVGVGSFVGSKYGSGSRINSTHKDFLKYTKSLILRVLGTPVNGITGKTILSVNKKENFQELSDKDFANMQGNLMEMSFLIYYLIATALLKGLFGGDDEEEKKPFYNITINKLNQIASEITAFANPRATYKNIVEAGIYKTLEDLYNFLEATSETFMGDGMEIYGVNAGKHKMSTTFKKAFMPSIMKDIISGEPYKLGFGTISEKQWSPAPFDKLFESELKTIERDSKEVRASKKKDLIEEFTESEKLYFGEQFEDLPKEKQEKVLKKALNKDKELKEYKKKIKALKK